MGDDDLLIHNGTILSNPGAIGRQGEIHDTVGKPECGRPFIKDEWGVQSVNRNYGCLRGTRFVVVCHDGSYRFWEWHDEKARLVSKMRGAAQWRAERQKAPQRHQRDAPACLGRRRGTLAGRLVVG